MRCRIGRLHIGASAWHDYAILWVQVGSWHKSLELGWVGHVRGMRILP